MTLSNFRVKTAVRARGRPPCAACTCVEWVCVEQQTAHVRTVSGTSLVAGVVVEATKPTRSQSATATGKADTQLLDARSYVQSVGRVCEYIDPSKC